MLPITELLLDLIALLLIASGTWLVYPPVGLIVGGVGVFWLSLGIKARRGYFGKEPERSYKAREVDA